MKDLDLANFAFKGLLLSAFCFGFMDVWFLNLFYATDLSTRLIWANISHLGDAAWMLIFALTLYVGFYVCSKFLHRPKKWKLYSNMSLFVFASVAITGIIAFLVNNSIGRAHPYLIEIAGPRGFDFMAFDSQYASWPSGHSTTTFALATAMALLFPRLTRVFYGLAAVTAVSRAMIGAHYISDVIMGATLGTVGTVLIYRWLKPKMRLHRWKSKRLPPQSTGSD